MWLLVMFDLPVTTAADRKAATDFRNRLLDFGFERCQFSVYLRFAQGHDQVAVWVRKIKAVLPQGGMVDCLCFTDKQYENIVRFQCRKQLLSPSNPEQFLLL